MHVEIVTPVSDDGIELDFVEFCARISLDPEVLGCFMHGGMIYLVVQYEEVEMTPLEDFEF